MNFDPAARRIRDRLVVIHFGAHRTGSTYLQAVFDKNAALLSKRGIQYRGLFGIKPVREAILASRRAAHHGDSAEFDRYFKVVEEYLNRFREDYPTDDLLISYEGILGGLAGAENGGFYRHHQLYLTRFLKIFEGERTHGVFAIREYGTVLESSYKKRVECGHKPRLQRTSAEVPAEVCWLPAVRALKSAFGTRFSLFTYEDFATSDRQTLEWLFQRTFNFDVELLELPRERVNPSPSGAAWGAMLVVNRMLSRFGSKARKRINRHLSSLLPAGKDTQPKLLSESARRDLNQRYAKDLQTLRQEIPDMYDPARQN